MEDTSELSEACASLLNDARCDLRRWMAQTQGNENTRAALGVLAGFVEGAGSTNAETEDLQECIARVERVRDAARVLVSPPVQRTYIGGGIDHLLDIQKLHYALPVLRERLQTGTLDPRVLRVFIDWHLKNDTGTDVFNRTCLDKFLGGLFQLNEIPRAESEVKPLTIGYVPTPSRDMLAIADGLGLTDKDTLIDVGCGPGKFLLTMHVLTGARCIGVDYETAYVRLLRQRIDEFQLSGRVSVVHGDAQSRDVDFSAGTAFYMYRPFQEPILRAVMGKIRSVAEEHPVRICARHMEDLLKKYPWLKRLPASNGSLEFYTVHLS